MSKIIIRQGDITRIKCEAIVNPANSLGVMGGGVALALKIAGGEIIEKEAIKQAPIQVGKAIITKAGKLNARYVIHSPTMEKPAQKIGIENVKLATEAALELAIKNKIKTLAFPGMGTGVGGVDYTKAAKVMIDCILARINKFEKIYIVNINPEFVEACKDYFSAVRIATSS